MKSGRVLKINFCTERVPSATTAAAAGWSADGAERVRAAAGAARGARRGWGRAGFAVRAGQRAARLPRGRHFPAERRLQLQSADAADATAAAAAAAAPDAAAACLEPPGGGGCRPQRPPPAANAECGR